MTYFQLKLILLSIPVFKLRKTGQVIAVLSKIVLVFSSVETFISKTISIALILLGSACIILVTEAVEPVKSTF